MVYCSICRFDVEYQMHWGSVYRRATCCKHCKYEEELQFLPPIIAKICKIEIEMRANVGRFAHMALLSGTDSEHLELSYFNKERTAFLEVCDVISSKSEYFFWNEFNTQNYLETQGYIQLHEFEIVKQFFYTNIPCFMSVENQQYQEAINSMNNMNI